MKRSTAIPPFAHAIIAACVVQFCEAQVEPSDAAAATVLPRSAEVPPNGLRAAIEAAGESRRTFIISQLQRVEESLAIPANVTLQFDGEGELQVTAGTLTINGAIESGRKRIFSGDGKVEFGLLIPETFPEWFGAEGDGAADDTAAFVRLYDALPVTIDSWSKVKGHRSNNATLVRLGNKAYRLTSQLSFGDDKNVRFAGHAPYSARFTWDGRDSGNYMFRYSARNNSHIMFENVVFHRGGVEIDEANRGYKVFQRVMWEDTPDFALRTNGKSVIGLLVDEFWITNCVGGISIAHEQSDMILIRRGNFTRNSGIPIVLRSSGVTVELCDFESNDVSGTKYENPYLHIAGVGRVNIVRNRFGNERFGVFAHPREAIVVGADVNSFTDGTMLNVHLLENEFLGHANASATLAANGVKLTQRNAGLVIVNSGRIQNYFGKFVAEAFMENGGDASTARGNITDLAPTQFTHGGAGFTFIGTGSVGEILAGERSRQSQNLLKGTADFVDWAVQGPVEITRSAGEGPDGRSQSAAKVTAQGSGAVSLVSEPLPAGTSNLVFSVWARAGSADRVNLNIRLGQNKLLTSRHAPIRLDSQWRRYYVTAPSVLGGTKVHAVITSVEGRHKDSVGDLYLYGPQLEPGRTPTEYIPASAHGPHAPKQLQSQMLGTAYVGYASAPPTEGMYSAGDLIYNTAPAGGSWIGWVCVESGSPGIWKTFGQISP